MNNGYRFYFLGLVALKYMSCGFSVQLLILWGPCCRSFKCWRNS